MNWKGKSADPQTAERQRIDFTRLAEDIAREDTPRVSEYAPLRERIDQAGRMSMQEAANACEALIRDIQEIKQKNDIEHQRVDRLIDKTLDTVQRALQEVNASIVKHNDSMAHICEVLEMIQGQKAVPLPALPKKTKTLPAPENEDATK